MRYRAIRPIIGKIKMSPGEFVPDSASKSWIKEKLKAGEIAVYHGGEDKWQKEEQLAQSTSELT